ncbi:ankyrin repeat-containing domain, PGG domain protein [Artemisia annua]|uniref:Ankyrin repeat-containing domain, PGG domain protein n=1 Tax=Artemisia annua TaxID=35608 RepID=A0A2U1KAV4_ARTAN|nr:ankyrin repeat-containing domain, PGG domain protein [Artemisia annua]
MTRSIISNSTNYLYWNNFEGAKTEYLKIGVPLYEASIKCDWEDAYAILIKNPELVKYSITENGETALHIAASAKGPKHVKQFVKNLVDLMSKEDLEIVNKNHNTALYLAAAAGNVETVKIMVEKNKTLVTIPGGGGMVPLYAAALFGNEKVVQYLYGQSQGLRDDFWTNTSRGWLLEKCVESDMFDIALDIVKKFPQIGRVSNVLGVLARKPEAFREKESSNIIERTINSEALVPSAKAGVFRQNANGRRELHTVARVFAS